MDVKCRQMKPIDVWREKDRIVDAEQASWKLWDTSTDDVRVGILLLVRDQLRLLTDRVDAWVPASLTLHDGDRIDVTMTLHLPETTEAVLRTRVEVERTRQQQAAHLLELRRNLQ